MTVHLYFSSAYPSYYSSRAYLVKVEVTVYVDRECILLLTSKNIYPYPLFYLTFT